MSPLELDYSHTSKVFFSLPMQEHSKLAALRGALSKSGFYVEMHERSPDFFPSMCEGGSHSKVCEVGLLAAKDAGEC